MFLIARAAAIAAPGLALGLDFALVPLLLVGLEIGGLFLLPGLGVWMIADFRVARSTAPLQASPG